MGLTKEQCERLVHQLVNSIQPHADHVSTLPSLVCLPLSSQTISCQIIAQHIQMLRRQTLRLEQIGTDEVFVKFQYATELDKDPIDPHELLIQGYRYLQAMLIIAHGLKKSAEQQRNQINRTINDDRSVSQPSVTFEENILLFFNEFQRAYQSDSADFHQQSVALKKLANRFAALLVQEGVAPNRQLAHQQLVLARDMGVMLEKPLPVCTVTMQGERREQVVQAEGVAVAEQGYEYCVEYSELIKIRKEFYCDYFGYSDHTDRSQAVLYLQANYSLKKQGWYQKLKQDLAIVEPNKDWLTPFIEDHLGKIVDAGVPTPSLSGYLPQPAIAFAVTHFVKRKLSINAVDAVNKDKFIINEAHFFRHGVVDFSKKESEGEKFELAKLQCKEVMKTQFHNQFAQYNQRYGSLYSSQNGVDSSCESKLVKHFYINLQTFSSLFAIEKLSPLVFLQKQVIAQLIEEKKTIGRRKIDFHNSHVNKIIFFCGKGQIRELSINDLEDSAQNLVGVIDGAGSGSDWRLRIPCYILCGNDDAQDLYFYLPGDRYNQGILEKIQLAENRRTSFFDHLDPRNLRVEEECSSPDGRASQTVYTYEGNLFHNLYGKGIDNDHNVKIKLPDALHHYLAEPHELRLQITQTNAALQPEADSWLVHLVGENHADEMVRQQKLKAIARELHQFVQKGNILTDDPLAKEQHVDKATLIEILSLIAYPRSMSSRVIHEKELEKSKFADLKGILPFDAGLYVMKWRCYEARMEKIAREIEAHSTQDLHSELALRLRAAFYLRLFLDRAYGYFNHLANFQRNLMITTLECLAMGSAQLTITAADNEQAAVFSAAMQTMMRSTEAMHNWDVLYKGITAHLQTGHHLRQSNYSVGVAQVNQVHPAYGSAMSSETQAKIHVIKEFTQPLKVTWLMKAWHFLRQHVLQPIAQLFGFIAGIASSIPSTSPQQDEDLAIEPQLPSPRRARPLSSLIAQTTSEPKRRLSVSEHAPTLPADVEFSMPLPGCWLGCFSLFPAKASSDTVAQQSAPQNSKAGSSSERPLSFSVQP